MNIGTLDLVEFAAYSDGPYIKDELSVKLGLRALLFSARFKLVGYNILFTFCRACSTGPFLLV